MRVCRALEAKRTEVGKAVLATYWGIAVPPGRIATGTLEVPPGQRIPPAGTSRHECDELTIVVTGQLDVGSGDRVVRLAEGDSCLIRTGEDHWCANPGLEPVRAVWLTLVPGGEVE